MAKFPVEMSDNEGISDAINYLLSGPAGLGQNFSGISVSTTGYLTGNVRTPFTSTTPITVYVEPIALSSSERLDPNTWKFTFATPQATPPFPLGSAIDVNGVSPSDYDGTYNAGAMECTTTYVIGRTTLPYPDYGPGTGGTVGLTLSGDYNSTDGDAQVVVNSASDRVFISAQLLNTITYKASETSQMFYTVAVNRYYPGTLSAGQPETSRTYDFDKTIAYRRYNFATLDPTESSIPNDLALSYSGNKAASAVTYPITYTVNPTTVTGSGTNLVLDIVQYPTGATTYSISNTTIEVVSGGEGYAIGDTLVVPGNLLGGGATPANDMNLTVSSVTSGTVTLEPIDTLFVNIIDTPPPGYYRYILEVEFVPSTGSDAVITQCELGYRSLSCQVVKE